MHHGLGAGRLHTVLDVFLHIFRMILTGSIQQPIRNRKHIRRNSAEYIKFTSTAKPAVSRQAVLAADLKDPIIHQTSLQGQKVLSRNRQRTSGGYGQSLPIRHQHTFPVQSITAIYLSLSPVKQDTGDKPALCGAHVSGINPCRTIIVRNQRTALSDGRRMNNAAVDLYGAAAGIPCIISLVVSKCTADPCACRGIAGPGI